MPTLYPYQVDGRDFLAERNRGLLIDEMGLGKTPQTLMAIESAAPVLVVCPAVMRDTWRDECDTWRLDLNPEVLLGRDSFRWPVAGEVLVIGYECLPECMRDVRDDEKAWEAREERRRDLTMFDGPSEADDAKDAEKRAEFKARRKAIRARGKPAAGTHLIADEAHRLKSNKTSVTKRFRELRSHTLKAGGRVWGLTGTPLLNRPKELWDLLTTFSLQGDSFGSWPRFCAAFNASQGRFGTVWGKPNMDVVPKALSLVAKRRLKRHVLADLPEKRYGRVRVAIDAEALAACEAAEAALLARGMKLQDLTAPALERAALGFEELSKARMALAKAKTAAAVQLLDERPVDAPPLLVFSAHREPVEKIGARAGWGQIHGGISPKARAEVVRAFQAGELVGVALTIQAAGVGITLTRAEEELFVDRGWTPGLNLQAEDRAHRIGQRASLLVRDLVADHPLDERMAEILTEKDELMAAVDAVAELEA